MKNFEIIPAIDLIDGACVRLEQGNYQLKTQYNNDPLEQAKIFEDHGIDYLHLVDLDAAKGSGNNLKVLETICRHTQLKVDFGGGVRAREDVVRALNLGARAVNIGSMAVKDQDLFQQLLNEFGGDQIWLSADVKDGKIATNGWLETSGWDIAELIRLYENDGLKRVVCTDVSKDGTLKGINANLYEQLKSLFPSMEWIASGGVKNEKDIIAARNANCNGIIIGKAIYEGNINLKNLETYVS